MIAEFFTLYCDDIEELRAGNDPTEALLKGLKKLFDSDPSFEDKDRNLEFYLQYFIDSYM